jgi:hypothetical protein
MVGVVRGLSNPLPVFRSPSNAALCQSCCPRGIAGSVNLRRKIQIAQASNSIEAEEESGAEALQGAIRVDSREEGIEFLTWTIPWVRMVTKARNRTGTNASDSKRTEPPDLRHADDRDCVDQE